HPNDAAAAIFVPARRRQQDVDRSGSEGCFIDEELGAGAKLRTSVASKHCATGEFVHFSSAIATRPRQRCRSLVSRLTQRQWVRKRTSAYSGESAKPSKSEMAGLAAAPAASSSRFVGGARPTS